MELNYLFKTFADETRLRILNLLSRGELCVTCITKVLKISQPKASRHLAQLRLTGLAECERKGVKVFYSLPKRPENIFQRLLLNHLIKGYFKGIPVLREDLERTKKLRSFLPRSYNLAV